jgi:hypothetical protein
VLCSQRSSCRKEATRTSRRRMPCTCSKCYKKRMREGGHRVQNRRFGRARLGQRQPAVAALPTPKAIAGRKERACSDDAAVAAALHAIKVTHIVQSNIQAITSTSPVPFHDACARRTCDVAKVGVASGRRRREWSPQVDFHFDNFDGANERVDATRMMQPRSRGSLQCSIC